MQFDLCDYEVSQEVNERKLIISCKDCENDFDMKKCFSGIILALGNEYTVDSLILSDYIEKQYSESTLKILKMYSRLTEELDALSSEERDDKKCKNCELYPKQMYSELKESLLSGGDIYNTFIKYVKILIEKEGCTTCRKETRDELSVIAKRLLQLKSEILLEAYGILE
ncbi:MAG: hypothetical protein ACOC85_01020 [Thermoplasmatota archaeon]